MKRSSLKTQWERVPARLLIAGEALGLHHLSETIFDFAIKPWNEKVFAIGGPDIALFPGEAGRRNDELDAGSVALHIRLLPEPKPRAFSRGQLPSVSISGAPDSSWPRDSTMGVEFDPKNEMCYLEGNQPALLSFHSHLLSLAAADVGAGTTIHYVPGKHLTPKSGSITIMRS